MLLDHYVDKTGAEVVDIPYNEGEHEKTQVPDLISGSEFAYLYQGFVREFLKQSDIMQICGDNGVHLATHCLSHFLAWMEKVRNGFYIDGL